MPLNVVVIFFEIVVLILAFSVHECAHAWTAWRLGDPTARMLGRVTLNPIATAALASGGTGDVLAGLIAGLMGQKLPPFEAAVTGVHLHSLAGLDLEASVGLAGVLASDLLPQLPRVMERLR